MNTLLLEAPYEIEEKDHQRYSCVGYYRYWLGEVAQRDVHEDAMRCTVRMVEAGELRFKIVVVYKSFLLAGSS